MHQTRWTCGEKSRALTVLGPVEGLSSRKEGGSGTCEWSLAFPVEQITYIRKITSVYLLPRLPGNLKGGIHQLVPGSGLDPWRIPVIGLFCVPADSPLWNLSEHPIALQPLSSSPEAEASLNSVTALNITPFGLMWSSQTNQTASCFACVSLWWQW